jgi:hypothetical protein
LRGVEQEQRVLGICGRQHGEGREIDPRHQRLDVIGFGSDDRLPHPEQACDPGVGVYRLRQ